MKNKNIKPNKIELPVTEDFQQMIDLLAVFTEASNALDNLQAVTNDHIAGVLTDLKPRYTELQEKLTTVETRLRKLATAHPEWFTDKKTIKTPFGTVSLRTSTKLLVENEEAVLARLEREAYRHYPLDEQEKLRTDFLAKYTRAKINLNKEALEAEDDAFLKTLGIGRIAEENFSAKPAVLDMGKAFQEAPEQQAA